MLTPWVTRLIIANVAIFAVQMIAPMLLSDFAFVPRLALVRPWTIVTYMFLHGGLGHLFFNMLGLFFFGPSVEGRLGAKRFARLYFLAGIGGALLSFLLSPNAAIIGASGGVFGVSLAFAWFYPRAVIHVYGIIPVEAWLLVTIYGVMELLSGVGSVSSGIAHWAHLGGYAGAALYLWLGDRYAPNKRFKAKVAGVPSSTEKVLKQNWKNVNLDGVHQLSREEVNRILDKINAQGIASLTPEEKLFLSNFVPPDDRKSWVQ